MMYKRIFLDANVLVDAYDSHRPFSPFSRQALAALLHDERVELYTSCDIITTIYYLRAKTDKAQALKDIERITTFCTVIEFANREVSQSCDLMKRNPNFADLEDTIQFVMAQKIEADLILSNDGGFFSEGIEVMDTKTYCTQAGL